MNSGPDPPDGDAPRAVLADLHVAADVSQGHGAGAVFAHRHVAFDHGGRDGAGAVGDLEVAGDAIDLDLARAVLYLERSDVSDNDRSAGVIDLQRQA